MGNSLIKLAHRNRSNDSGADKNRNRTQRNGENSNGMPVAGPSNENQHILSSPIFKLNDHCFDELFEYLSLKDLHSLGQTCKSMQQMTGKSFTRNYSASKCICSSDGIYFKQRGEEIGAECIKIPGFIQLITWIAIENYNLEGNTWYQKTYLLDKFKYFKLNADELKSVKKLSLGNVWLNKQTVDYISKTLPNIEVLELIQCTVYGDLYDVLLKYCKNLRNIQLSGIDFRNENKYKWLLRKYEKLEQFGLGARFHRPHCMGTRSLNKWMPDETIRIDELCTFFELNPNIRNFSCDLLKLSSNKDTLLNCKVKLDIFELREDKLWVCDCGEHKTAWDLLIRLHTHGFYKRLHINAKKNFHHCKPSAFDHSTVSAMLSIPINTDGVVLTHLIEYAETWQANKNEIPLEELLNVERLHLFRESFDILRIIQQLKNLRKIKILEFESAEIVELNVLNREREKLAGAQKVTIYVPDAVYLATKWATKNGTINFNLIEMKRTNSYEWQRSYDEFDTIIYQYGVAIRPRGFIQNFKKMSSINSYDF